jgi:Xaa-Pro aminopeptidase
MNAECVQRRVRAVRNQFNKNRIDALVVTKPANVTYLTGFSGEDSWAVVAGGAVYLLTDSRYTEQAQKECPLARIVERKDPIAQAAAKLVGKLKSARTVAIEKSISLAFYAVLKKNVEARLKAVDGLIEDQRSVKDEGELAAIRSAAAIAATAFERAVRHVRPGITESELAGILDLEMRRQGAKVGFETIVAFGPNASRPHHQPSQRKLAQRDAILIDFGARYGGYCCDITRSFAFGKPTAAYCRAYQAVEKAQAAAIQAAIAGVELVEVDAAARNAIRESGLPVYGHGTGHGFGLEIHEIPFLKEKAKGKLKTGQIITIEPGVYLPGKLGVRIEDDILITDDGCEILTGACPRKSPLKAADEARV